MTARRSALAGYELEHRLGEGGSGTVWRARQLSSLGRPVAVKRVRVPAGAAELRTEAGVLVELDHPHIVRVFELVPDGDDGVAIAMQLATGGSLEERLARRGGALAADEVAGIVRKLAAALASAHRRGILHRDVKPGNVLFTSDGEPLLADFGIASWLHDDGLLRGTEAYLDPTLLAGRMPDASSDLYGLGALARTMLGGDLTGAPEPLASVVARCLAPDPADRFAAADGVLDALDAPPAPDLPSELPERRVDDADGRVTTRTFGPRPPMAPSHDGAAPRWRTPAVAVGLVLVVVGAFTALRHDDVHLSAPTTAAPAAAPACPSVTAVGGDLVADVDGDGCNDAVGRAGNVLSFDGHRYEVGAPGDVVVLGDWDCDGRATPAVFRPTSGTAHLFDGWAEPTRPLPSVRTIEAVTPPTEDCD